MTALEVAAQAICARLQRPDVTLGFSLEVDPGAQTIHFDDDATSAHTKLSLKGVCDDLIAAVNDLPLIERVGLRFVFRLQSSMQKWVEIHWTHQHWIAGLDDFQMKLKEVERRLRRIAAEAPDEHATLVYGIETFATNGRLISEQPAGSPRQALMLYAAAEGFHFSIEDIAKAVSAVYIICPLKEWQLPGI